MNFFFTIYKKRTKKIKEYNTLKIESKNRIWKRYDMWRCLYSLRNKLLKKSCMIFYEENQNCLILEVDVKQSVIILTHVSFVQLKKSWWLECISEEVHFFIEKFQITYKEIKMQIFVKILT